MSNKRGILNNFMLKDYCRNFHCKSVLGPALIALLSSLPVHLQAQPVSNGTIVRIPSAEDMRRGAKIEVITNLPPSQQPMAGFPLPAPAQPSKLENTGTGGERPIPPYPSVAEKLGQQGTMTLSARSPMRLARSFRSRCRHLPDRPSWIAPRLISLKGIGRFHPDCADGSSRLVFPMSSGNPRRLSEQLRKREPPRLIAAMASPGRVAHC